MKKFKTQEIRDLFSQVMHEEISFSRMVEILNERVSEASEPKFKKGDKVRIKDGISSETHLDMQPCFMVRMDDLIGKELTVDGCVNGVVFTKESGYHFHEDWLEPYVEELKEADLAIFWDELKEYSSVRFYDRLNESEEYYQHKDHIGVSWANAIKFESIEQYERFIKGEI